MLHLAMAAQGRIYLQARYLPAISRWAMIEVAAAKAPDRGTVY